LEESESILVLVRVLIVFLSQAPGGTEGQRTMRRRVLVPVLVGLKEETKYGEWNTVRMERRPDQEQDYNQAEPAEDAQ
jgi:hypothetical protein